MAVAITRMEMSARGLRLAAAKDAKAPRRNLALALVLKGADRKTAAETCGMDRQTLQWGGSGKRPVEGCPDERGHRDTADWLEGLSNRCPAGSSPPVSVE